MPKGLPLRLKDYSELVDLTGRAILEKNGVTYLIINTLFLNDYRSIPGIGST
ncbi:MAG: hypothetical protein ABW080_06165 [Candidatus Thiodiazotropha sp.]